MTNEIEQLEAEVERLKADLSQPTRMCDKCERSWDFHWDEDECPWCDLAAANAIIEKLPMTADNVRVVPGMQLWANDGGLIDGLGYCDPEPGGWVKDCNGTSYAVDDLYSTREAAREAADASQ